MPNEHTEWPITQAVQVTCAELVGEARENQEYRPVVMVLIINHAEEVLLVQSTKNPDDWGLPQGVIEEGENTGQALFG